MGFKILAGVVAMVLAIAYLAPPLYKLQDVALAVVIVIGLVMMLVDLVHSLQSKEED